MLIVGGGVVGLALAWRTAQRGLRTVLVERGELGAGASRVAAGMLAPVTEADFGEDALLELNLAAAARYPGWVDELTGATGIDVGHRRCGTLMVARDADEAEALHRLVAFRESLGLEVERLRPSQARRLEPALAPTVRAAAHAPADHAVDPRALVCALASAAARAGAVLRPGCEVAEVLVTGGRAHGVRLAGGAEVAAETVVVAAGGWSREIGGLPAEARVPVRPVKGQLLRLRDPAGPGLVDRVVRTEEAYLVPRGDGRYVLGATVEERGFDTSVTAGALHDLLRAAAEVVPGVLELEVEEALAGLRPGTPDNAPALGPGALPGLVWATGHHRNGVLLAPLTADLLADLLTTGQLPELARPFAPGRFAAEVRA